jgi:hypothetical protein
VNWSRVIDAIRTGGLSERREEPATDEWAERERAILSDPIGRMLWTTMRNHGLSLNSRSPVYGWQVRRAYVLTCEDLIAQLNQERR